MEDGLREQTERSVETPVDFTSPEELYKDLVKVIRNYHPSTDLSAVEKAYQVASKAHKDQKRKSGEPYIIHPLCVGIILSELQLDKETIIAGILHDVLEDTDISYDELKGLFGEEVVQLVEGVTKLTQLTYSKDKVEVQAENLRKMFLAMAKDIRVILIKLADRLHNMRTMQYQTPQKQIEKSRETMDIYAPIAQRLGISKIKIELDDLSLKYLEPEVYHDLSVKLDLNKEERESFIAQIIDEVSVQIKRAGIEAKVDGRVKHFFSIYKKMINQNKTLEQIYDLFAVRIVVNTVKDCYAALGIIHEMYKPIPGRFKDYIAMPKPNMYQSLHTTLIGPQGQPFEIQIRTYEMHRIAEYGIAAHWRYKEAQDGKKSRDTEEAKLTWLRQILEWQKEMSDNKEFLRLLKNDLDLFSDSVYCFTPTGDVKNLPAGSTPIDFAYSIHSAVGNKMVGARVSGRMVTFDYVIQNGDQIEIITSQNSKGPSRDWLNLVKSTQAKNKINQWFKAEIKEDNIIRGRELLNVYCKSKGLILGNLTKPEYIESCIRKYGLKDWESICAAVGHGALKEGQIINRLQEEYEKRHKKEISDATILEMLEDIKSNTNKRKPKKNRGGIIVQGMDDLEVHFSRCCSPVPGDEIIGFITRGRGVSIHRTDCINIINMPKEERIRLIDAEWNVPKNESSQTNNYIVEINIYANNHKGVLFGISKVFTENDINIEYINTKNSKREVTTLSARFEVNGTEQLDFIIKKLRNIEDIIDIERTSG